MGNWGIAKTATPKEKLKSEMADFLGGLNSVGNIDYSAYSEIFDFSMKLLDEMYDLGKLDSSMDKPYLLTYRVGRIYENHSYAWFETEEEMQDFIENNDIKVVKKLCIKEGIKL